MFKKLFLNRNAAVILFTLFFVNTGFENIYPALTNNQITSENKKYSFVIKWNEPSRLFELHSTGNS
jgi:hypothetical protein